MEEGAKVGAQLQIIIYRTPSPKGSKALAMWAPIPLNSCDPRCKKIRYPCKFAPISDAM